MTLVEVLVGSLMGRLVDTCLAVRQLCVKGLGNIADTNLEMVRVHLTLINIQLLIERVGFTGFLTGSKRG